VNASFDAGSDVPKVLVVDDQVGEIVWLLDDIRRRGCETVVVSTEDAARAQLEAVRDGREVYRAAIFDVMVAVKDLWDLIALGEDVDEKFFADSRSTGLRLCEYARRELGLTPAQLPIACLTVRDDAEVQRATAARGIPLYHRMAEDSAASIRGFLDQYLPQRQPGESMD
jgi:hypothetical protein